MIKVKNNSANYTKRSQIRSACVVVDRVTDAPKKRTAADFKNAVIDNNSYVTFRNEAKSDKRK
jgi:hypothetical protein